jgi:hypothetical protein
MFQVLIGIAAVWLLVIRISAHLKRPPPTTEFERKIHAASTLHMRGIALGYLCGAVFVVDPFWFLASKIRFIVYGVAAIAVGMVFWGSFKRRGLELDGPP